MIYYHSVSRVIIYHCLELRFNRVVRYIVTIVFIVQSIIYVGIVIYAPAVALETVTGLGRWFAVWIVGGVCIFYTSIGGLKAVVWTDSFQISIMLAGFVAIIAKGVVDYDGFDNILDTYRAGERNVWDDFQFDPRYRHTFYSIVIGGVLGTWGNGFCCNQAMVQRILACRDHANVSMLIVFLPNTIIVWVIV